MRVLVLGLRRRQSSRSLCGDQVVAAAGVDWYAGAGDRLDALHFGCTERDYLDAAHVDIDCLHRFMATVFDAPSRHGDGMLSQALLKAYRGR